jgi:excisionase family DNA binding protein
MTEDALALRYVAELLEQHRQRCRQNGLVPPVELASALSLATGRQRPPQLDPDEDLAERWCVTYDEAAAALAVSRRTVERLVARGDLPVVEIGGCRRVAREDLAAFVASLPRRRGALVEVA